MAYVNPGELKQLIYILVPDRARQDDGHYRVTAAREIPLRAAVRSVRASDVFDGGAARAQETLQFIVRWRADLNTDMSVRFRGQIYAIESIDATPFAGAYMRIRGVSYDSGVGG